MFRLSLFVALVGFVVFSAGVRAEQKIVAGSLPPLIMAQGVATIGIAPEILALAAKVDPDLTPFYVMMPWKRALHIARNDMEAAVIPLGRTADREADYHWVGPLFVSSTWLWSGVKQPVIGLGPDEASKRLVGVIRGGAGSERLTSMGFNNLVSFHGMDQMTQRLMAGDIDLMHAADAMVYHLLRQQGIDSNQLIPSLALGELAFYLGLSAKQPIARADRWNAVIDTVRRTPEYRDIIDKYGLDRSRNGLAPK